MNNARGDNEALLKLTRTSEELREPLVIRDWLNSGNFIRLNQSGTDVFTVTNTGNLILAVPLSIGSGGTGANTPLAARAALGVLDWTVPPANSTSPGTPGQIAYDATGHFYVCYQTNLWAKFTGIVSPTW